MTKHFAVYVSAMLTVAKILGMTDFSWAGIASIYLLGFFIGSVIEATLVRYYDDHEIS